MSRSLRSFFLLRTSGNLVSLPTDLAVHEIADRVVFVIRLDDFRDSPAVDNVSNC